MAKQGVTQAVVFYGYTAKSRPPTSADGGVEVLHFGNYRWAVAAIDSVRTVGRTPLPVEQQYPDIQWVADLNWYIRESGMAKEVSAGPAWYWGVIDARNV